MKKIGTIALAILLTGGIVGNNPAQAKEEGVQVIDVQEKDTTNYMHYTGVIMEVENGDNEIRLTAENEEKMIMILRINDDSLLFNSGTTNSVEKKDLKKGMTVEAYYDKNKPMILIYPATVTPEIVIVKDKDVYGEVKIGKYDKDFLSLDGELKLNISEDTIILNQQGKEIELKEVEGKELAIFYTATTRSIPAQATPSKIIALDYVTEEMAKVLELIENDHYMNGKVKMIPLRKVAEQLGYHVLSQPEIKGALITKQNQSITIKRGDKTYGYNKSIGKFPISPELKGMKTYVSEEFLDLLLK